MILKSCQDPQVAKGPPSVKRRKLAKGARNATVVPATFEPASVAHVDRVATAAPRVYPDLTSALRAGEAVLQLKQGGFLESYKTIGTDMMAASKFWSKEAQQKDEHGYLAFNQIRIQCHDLRRDLQREVVAYSLV
jgi:hypothetical protein